jgi:hypothetical protein
MIEEEVQREGVAWGRSAAETAALHVDPDRPLESCAAVMHALDLTLAASVQVFLQHNGPRVAQIWEEAAIDGIRTIFPAFRRESSKESNLRESAIRPRRMN